MRRFLVAMAAISFITGGVILAVALQKPESALAQETEERVFRGPIGDVLDDLVQQRVIDQEQAERISAAFEDRLFRFGRGFKGTHYLDTVAELLGIDIDELAQQLREGATIAEIAGDQKGEVIDALVAQQNARIDQAVEDGRVSEERADDIRRALAGRVEAMVNGECGWMGPGMMRGFPGPPGFGGEGFRGRHDRWLPGGERGGVEGTGSSA